VNPKNSLSRAINFEQILDELGAIQTMLENSLR
jgi:hypothetical protein